MSTGGKPIASPVGPGSDPFGIAKPPTPRRLATTPPESSVPPDGKGTGEGRVNTGNPFGVPVGDASAPPPTAPPPVFLAGESGFTIDEAPPSEATGDSPSASRAQIDAPNAGFSLPEYAGERPPLAAPEPERPRKPPPVDFKFLLTGYACYVERDRVVFGRPYGTRIIDRHAFDVDGSLDRGYQLFVEAKIREGFIPQTEMTGELPRTVTVMPLDQDRLAAAWRALM